MSLKNVKIAKPTYSEIIPSTKQKVSIHPFKVGDEKVLLMAAESKDTLQMSSALKQVIDNCVDGVEANSLASYDLEYLFLKLRSISVGETVELGLKCISCDVTNKINIDLTEIGIREDDRHTNVLKINEDLVFKMKYPDINDLAITEQNVDSMLDLIVKSVETVFYGEETINIGPADREDLLSIINQLTSTQFQLFQDFFLTAPKVSHTVDFKCGECGEANTQKLEGLANFF